MSLKEKVGAYIQKHPNATILEIANACDCGMRSVSRYKGELVAEGQVEIAKKNSETNFKYKKDGSAEASFLTPKRIKSKDDLIQVCDIDLEFWEIVSYEVTTWEGYRKNKTSELKWNSGVVDGSVSDKGDLFVETLYRVNIKLKPRVESSFETLRDKLIGEIKNYAPKYPVIKYPKIKDGHLLVIDPADIHIGKLCRAFETGDEYNHNIAIDRAKSGVIGLLQKAQSFPVDKILFVIGNDMLHVDNAKSTTTSGTFQDSELMWYDAFIIAKKLLIECIEMLITVAPVHIQYDPSNHDYLSGFMLAQSIEAWFHNNKNITFNISPAHRKFFEYGANAIGTTHNDGAKEADLALLMAHECSFWHKCKHRYIYTHHIHHKKSKDYMSVCVESLRSPSGTDSWHHRNGYQHAPKAIEAYIHHPLHGQIARITHLF